MNTQPWIDLELALKTFFIIVGTFGVVVYLCLIFDSVRALINRDT